MADLTQAPSLTDLLALNPMTGAPKAPERRFWTGAELKRLREAYPVGGLAAAIAVLPGRSAKSIYQKAGDEGIRSPQSKRGGKRERWTTNDQIDRLILQTYGRARSPRDVARLAQTLRRPSWWVSKRARTLGLVSPRFKETPWTPAEIEIVSENAHRVPSYLKAALKRAGFTRSETAIVVKLKRLGADRTDPNNYTATGLAGVLGVDPHRITDWITKGWLKAKRRGNDAPEDRDHWWISRRDAARFIVENVHAINFAKVDKHWLVDLLTHEGRAGANAMSEAA